MTEPQANAVRWLLINGGIHLTSSCATHGPPSLVLSLWLVTSLNIVRAQAGPGCLPTSATKTICNPANRAQRLRESTRSRGARYKLPSVSSLAGPTYTPQSLIFRLGLFIVKRVALLFD